MDAEHAAKVSKHLYALVISWATSYIGAAPAQKVARYSLARLFQLACTAWETDRGPYAELFNLASPLLISEAMSAGTMNMPMNMGKLPAVDEQTIEDVASLYAYVYTIQYLGQWSLSEREEITMQIRWGGRYTSGYEWTLLDFIDAMDPSCALRRAVEGADAPDPYPTLVRDVAEQIRCDEAERGLRWLGNKYSGIEEA